MNARSPVSLRLGTAAFASLGEAGLRGPGTLTQPLSGLAGSSEGALTLPPTIEYHGIGEFGCTVPLRESLMAVGPDSGATVIRLVALTTTNFAPDQEF